MLDADIQHRVRRILRGERRTDDFDRIFLALRSRHHGRESIEEIGNFVAHRDERQKGPVTQKARDIYLSFRNWLRTGSGVFEKAEIIEAARANLRIVTAEQLRARFDLTPNVTKSVLEQAIKKLDMGKNVTDRERRVFDYLGSAFIWNPAFTDDSIFDDLVYVLKVNNYLLEADVAKFAEARVYLSLYVLVLMHGSTLLFADGATGMLVAGCSNKDGRLEVKVALTVTDYPKPIYTHPCLYWTSLEAREHCAQSLCAKSAWDTPLEVDNDGFLAEVV